MMTLDVLSHGKLILETTSSPKAIQRSANEVFSIILITKCERALFSYNKVRRVNVYITEELFSRTFKQQ